MIKRYGTASFYRKGQGEVQFTFMPPRWGRKTTKINEAEVEVQYVDQEGAILVEAAKSLADSEKSDWTNKIRMSLGFNDYGQILAGMRSGTQSVKLVHTHPTDGHVSSLEIVPGNEGTYRLTVAGKRLGDSEKGFAGVYMNTAQIAVLLKLIEFAIPASLGWSE